MMMLWQRERESVGSLSEEGDGSHSILSFKALCCDDIMMLIQLFTNA
jgi:hypothetical protein